jgi:hypothetical protein
MFSTSLWIILLGFLIILFIPVIPLGAGNKKTGDDAVEQS